MKSYRLNDSKRNYIIDELINHTIGGEIKKLEERQAKLAQAVRDDALTKDEKYIIRTAPTGLIPTMNFFRVSYFAGPSERAPATTVALYFSGNLSSLSDGMPSKMEICPARWSNASAKCYEYATTFGKQLADFYKDYEDLKARRKELRIKAKNILNVEITTKSLIAKWPEIEPFVRTAFANDISKDAMASEIKLPAVTREALNKEFELPVKELTV